MIKKNCFVCDKQFKFEFDGSFCHVECPYCGRKNVYQSDKTVVIKGEEISTEILYKVFYVNNNGKKAVALSGDKVSIDIAKLNVDAGNKNILNNVCSNLLYYYMEPVLD